MILKVVIENKAYPIKVPEQIISGGGEFFDRIDRDMDKGWQMSREWVDNPNQVQRCQIVGDKMLTALHHDKQEMMVLLSAYVLARVPGVQEIHIDTNGEMMETELVLA